MSTQRRSVSRRPTAGPSRARNRAAGTIEPPVAEPTTVDDEPQPTRESAAAIRAARAEERRVPIEETVQRSVFAERTGRLRAIFADTRAEIKKVTWPDRDTTRNLTIVVIGISVVMGIVLGGIDYVLFQIFEALP